MDNSDLARLLGEMGDILELTGGNAFKVRAYRQAAKVIDLLPDPVSELARQGALERLPGIGPRIASKIGEILDHGTCADYEAMKQAIPPGILELLEIEGVGPKTVATVWHQAGITSLDGLAAATESGVLQSLPRMGPSRVHAIAQAIERHRARAGRTLLHRALTVADTFTARLRALSGVVRVEAAGSVRRRLETVGDLDLLVATATADLGPQADAVTAAFVAFPEVEAVLGRGPTKSSVRLKMGLHVDLRVLPLESFGAALHYFTGSKAHNIAIRTLAVRRGLKISEYGVFDRAGRRRGGAREEEVFAAVGLPFIPPELREGAGEIEAAAEGRLPTLLEERDLEGDLHVHTDWSSDGRSSLQEMLDAATRLGRRYLAITDHSRSRPLGLTAERLAEQAHLVYEAVGALHHGPRLLRGIEVDILEEGALDLPLDALAQLDWVVASVHKRFNDPPAVMTERLCRAMRSGVVDVIGHPSGRLLGQRDPYSFDLHRVLAVAREEGVALEINASPDRLDLNDKACRLARRAGVKLVISSDSHLDAQLANLRFGVWVARRGWLEAADVLNTRPVTELLQARARRLERKGLRATELHV
jgi:DNA polymerase (family 10)